MSVRWHSGVELGQGQALEATDTAAGLLHVAVGKEEFAHL